MNSFPPSLQALPSTSQSAPAKVNWGAIYYHPVFLYLYDFWVLNLSNTYAWHCSTSSILLPFFTSNFSSKHLDVGVGTGYFPASALAQLSPYPAQTWENSSSSSISSLKNGIETHHLTLVDLNKNSLDAAARRIARPSSTRCLVADVFSPLPLLDIAGQPERFDSISIFYLLHCLRGPCASKSPIFTNLKKHLSDSGVLYGASVLGKGVERNRRWFGNGLMWFYNGIGLFDNWGDGEEEITGLLREEFGEVETRVVGCVLVFRAWKPKR